MGWHSLYQFPELMGNFSFLPCCASRGVGRRPPSFSGTATGAFAASTVEVNNKPQNELVPLQVVDPEAWHQAQEAQIWRGLLSDSNNPSVCKSDWTDMAAVLLQSRQPSQRPLRSRANQQHTERNTGLNYAAFPQWVFSDFHLLSVCLSFFRHLLCLSLRGTL